MKALLIAALVGGALIATYFGVTHYVDDTPAKASPAIEQPKT